MSALLTVPLGSLALTGIVQGCWGCSSVLFSSTCLQVCPWHVHLLLSSLILDRNCLKLVKAESMQGKSFADVQGSRTGACPGV